MSRHTREQVVTRQRAIALTRSWYEMVNLERHKDRDCHFLADVPPLKLPVDFAYGSDVSKAPYQWANCEYTISHKGSLTGREASVTGKGNLYDGLALLVMMCFCVAEEIINESILDPSKRSLLSETQSQIIRNTIEANPELANRALAELADHEQ